MGAWHKAKVKQTRAAAEGLFELWLEVAGTGVEGAHRRAGQFVKLRIQGVGEALFAIASPPGEDPGRLEFLVKTGSPVADALCRLSPGGEVEVGEVQGAGFPVERARGKEVLLFGTGSGISALRSLIGVLLRDRSAYGRVTLYFGARTPDAFAYAHELDVWEERGIRVLRTVSRPGASGWNGLKGYVQTHVPPRPLEDAVAFLCGQQEMVKGVTEVLTRRGLPQESIHLNY